MEAECDRFMFKILGREEAISWSFHFQRWRCFEALSSLCGDKAPCLDGFTLAFWKFHWDIFKEEVLSFLLEFFEHVRFVRSLNTTFLVLISKKGGADELKDFRRISLVCILYKFLAKVLANRPKRVIASCYQNAFAKG